MNEERELKVQHFDNRPLEIASFMQHKATQKKAPAKAETDVATIIGWMMLTAIGIVLIAFQVGAIR